VSRSTSLLGRAGPLIAARLVSACITLVIPLVLARVMPQAEYGTYKLLFLVSVTTAAILPCGVAQSLYFFVPRTKEPRVYFGQTLTFMLAAGATGALVLWTSGPWLASALSTPQLAEHRLELALYTGLVVSAFPLEASITSRGRTRLAAATYLSSDALRSAALVLPALAGLGLHGMMRAMIGWAALRLAATLGAMLGGQRGRLWDRRLFRKQLAYAVPFGVAILFAIPQQYAHQFIVAHAVGPALFAIYAVACFELPFVDLFYTPTGEVLMVQLGELELAGRRAEGAAAFREAVGRLAVLILPPIAFIFAVAPDFITTMFGPRFADAAPIFRMCLLVMPLGIWPLDATLRARGETRHILATYVVKALVSIPLTWAALQRFGLMGAAGSHVASELLGRAILAWRVPASLSTPARRARIRDLVPVAKLARTGCVSVALAAMGAGTLQLASALELAAPGAALHHLLPLALASTVFGAGYLVQLAASSASVPGALAALLGRRRDGLRPSIPLGGRDPG
jgi:O-antigen/teichoic acid export membrane protein